MAWTSRRARQSQGAKERRKYYYASLGSLREVQAILELIQAPQTATDRRYPRSPSVQALQKHQISSKARQIPDTVHRNRIGHSHCFMIQTPRVTSKAIPLSF